jgi:urocanate hydratase
LLIKFTRKAHKTSNKQEALKLAKAALETGENESTSLAGEVTGLMSKEVSKIGKMPTALSRKSS